MREFVADLNNKKTEQINIRTLPAFTISDLLEPGWPKDAWMRPVQLRERCLFYSQDELLDIPKAPTEHWGGVGGISTMVRDLGTYSENGRIQQPQKPSENNNPNTHYYTTPHTHSRIGKSLITYETMLAAYNRMDAIVSTPAPLLCHATLRPRLHWILGDRKQAMYSWLQLLRQNNARAIAWPSAYLWQRFWHARPWRYTGGFLHLMRRLGLSSEKSIPLPWWQQGTITTLGLS